MDSIELWEADYRLSLNCCKEADLDFLNLPQTLTNHKTTGSGQKMENLLPLPFSEIFNMSSLFPITLRLNDLLSITTNFLQPPSLIIPALQWITNQERMKKKVQDTNQRGKWLTGVQNVKTNTTIGLSSPKQCAGEIPTKFWTPEKSPATDSQTQREPERTETIGQPSPHFSIGENPPPGDRYEKNSPDECEKPTSMSKWRPVQGLRRLPET
ncbi:hypothetical protein Cgig2_023023 [Carnegiea gigantea]|uniref:Uncharacterized protein n=1 Tax=Carnegiea gigantea TaxID=171969 RepID=A0A9Q1K9I9_9CARY|nr:hypothetical protein Cgig2_023023 [Carnegiea gigantea]